MVSHLLFTTSNVGSGRTENLNRLIRSIQASRRNNYDIKLYLLLQNTASQSARMEFPEWVVVYTVDNLIPLSVARNKLLQIAFKNEIIHYSTIIAFPDDDCWYPDGTVDFITSAFAHQENIDFFFCRYASKTQQADDQIELKKPSAQNVISYASSNTIFLKGSLVKQLRYFDETLGVGTQLNGGEDTEYAIRAFLAARKTLFADHAIVGHRDIDPTIRVKYFAGSFIAIRRNALKNPLIAVAMARKFAVGLIFLMMGRLEFRNFTRALQLH